MRYNGSKPALSFAAILCGIGFLCCISCTSASENGKNEHDKAALTGETPALQKEHENREQTVKEVVTGFGAAIKKVSLLAPEEVLIPQLKEVYRPYVTPGLLQKWTANPSEAPGREVSSPWPEKIEIKDMQPAGNDQYQVEGSLIYLTSNEVAHGGIAASKKISMVLTRQQDGSWLISEYKAF